uniref:DDE Tnp4 domain-containing protein n=1 Tax=Opuntia streptacantha TaxID=393608 RepID=A0A7C9ADL7_OPUST
MKELFNYRHASLRGVIERTFGVLQSMWKIVDDRMPQMNLNSQLEIVIAVCTVHNFMRLHESGIPMTPRPPSSNRTAYVDLFDKKSKKAMDNFRNQLALEIAES